MPITITIDGVAATSDPGDGSQLFSYINSVDNGSRIRVQAAARFVLESSFRINARTPDASWNTLTDKWNSEVASGDHDIVLPSGVIIIDYASVARACETEWLAATVLIEPENHASLHSEDSPYPIASADDLAWISEDFSGTSYLFDYAFGASHVAWKYFRFNNQHGNGVFPTFPADLDHETYLPSQQSDFLLFWYCVIAARSNNSINPQPIPHEGKKLWMRCVSLDTQQGTGTGDGFFTGGRVGEGPVIHDTCFLRMGGENSGYGAHGFGSPSSIFPNFVSAETQPNVGFTSKRTITTRPSAWLGETEQGYVKNQCEHTYGSGIVYRGHLFDEAWVGAQRFAWVIKLSTESKDELAHIYTRRIVWSDCVLRKCEGILVTAEYTATPSNPPIEDILIDNCVIYLCDEDLYGAGDGAGFLFQIGDMPAKFTIRHSIIDCTKITGFFQLTNEFTGHPLTKLANWRWENNIFLLPGTQSYEFTGVGGEVDTFVQGPVSRLSGETYLARGIWDYHCDSGIFQKNIYVANALDTQKNFGELATSPVDLTETNWIFREAAGRETVLALLRNPTASDPNDRDYRLTPIAENTYIGSDGKLIGPDWVRLYQQMGPTWPFSWTPLSVPPYYHYPIAANFAAF